MSDDRFGIAGPPYREPAEPPRMGTAPIDFLHRRSLTDPIAKAAVDLYANGTELEDAITQALQAYASSLEETRIALAWYADRHSPTLIVKKERP